MDGFCFLLFFFIMICTYYVHILSTLLRVFAFSWHYKIPPCMYFRFQNLLFFLTPCKLEYLQGKQKKNYSVNRILDVISRNTRNPQQTQCQIHQRANFIRVNYPGSSGAPRNNNQSRSGNSSLYDIRMNFACAGCLCAYSLTGVLICDYLFLIRPVFSLSQRYHNRRSVLKHFLFISGFAT